MKIAKMMSKAFLLGTALFVAHPVYANPADLDTTFSGDGKTTLAFGTTGISTAFDVQVQSDGKIVTAGTFGGNWAIARHNSNGTVDTTFNNDGKVTTNYIGNDRAFALAIQSDGKIIAVGDGDDGNGNIFCITRYLANGTHDTSFSGDGKFGSKFGASEAGAYCVAIQSDGKILVGGYRNIGGNEFMVARFLTNGALDTSFSGDGWVELGTSEPLSEDNEVTGLAIQADGKIVTVSDSGAFTGNIVVARLNSNGTFDNTFDSDGRVSVDLGGSERSAGVVVQTSGKITVSCTSSITSGGVQSDYLGLIRLNSTGSLDTSFSSDGKVILTNLTAAATRNNLALQSDGKIVLTGNKDADFVLVRFNSSGTLDTTFSGDGITTTNFSNEFSQDTGDYSYAVAMQSDGKIVVAGESYAEFGLARYLGFSVAGSPSPLSSGTAPTSGSSIGSS